MSTPLHLNVLEHLLNSYVTIAQEGAVWSLYTKGALPQFWPSNEMISIGIHSNILSLLLRSGASVGAL